MLEHLSITNYVLLDSLSLDFSSGLVALTGETGSGKSIILGALSLLLGAKVDKEAIREGENEAVISGEWETKDKQVLGWLEDKGIYTEDDRIIIRRTIRQSGRHLYTINSTPITRVEGEELGLLLMDVSSQNEHQSLLRKKDQLNILDSYSKSVDLREEYNKTLGEYREIENTILETKNKLEKSSEERDYLSYCLSELKKANLREGEEEEKKEKLSLLSSSEFIKENADAASSEIDNAKSSITNALSLIEKANKKDTRLTELYNRLDSVAIDVDDIFHTLRDYSSALYYDENEIELLNERISEIQKLKRRFGGSEKACIEKQVEIENSLNLLDNSELLLDTLIKERDKKREELISKSKELNKRRVEGALALSKKIENNLHELSMEDASFNILVEYGNEVKENGMDSVSYLLRANKGEKTTLLENAASGGELSRIMLAIKVALESEDETETILFDEIDSGLGGRTANKVAQKLKTLSSTHQVIVITHLSQIASKADMHLVVYKEVKDNRTISTIERVEGEKRVKEIARLLSGNTSDESIKLAEKLIEVQD